MTLINKDLATSAEVHLAGTATTKAKCIRLTAPSIQSTTGTKLGGFVVNPQAEWRAVHTERLRANRRNIVLHVPAGSAAFVEV